jgi:hypothetical protein
MLCMVACSKRFASAEKSAKGGEASAGGEFRIDVSGDLDRADWLPDLHQDTPPPPAIFSPLTTCSAFRNDSAPAQILLASRSHLGKSTRCQVECLLAAEHGADRPLVSPSPFASAILIVHCCLVTVESASSKMFEDDDTTSIATPTAFRFSFLCRSRLLLHSLRSKHQCFEVLGISDDRSWYRKDCGCVGKLSP